MKLLFYPQYPDKEYYSITHIINRLGYQVTRDLEASFDVAFLWSDVTELDCPPELLDAADGKHIINQNCLDISKKHVEQLQYAVFGYGSFIDPLTHKGRCVEKPNANGVKGGRVIDTPIDSFDDSKVYQALIDSTVGDYQQEYRVPVIFGQLPIVYLVQQAVANDSLDYRVQKPPELLGTHMMFSYQEQVNITKFCQLIGLDFGELDIVRCSQSQRLFILDANKTPAGYGMLNYFSWHPQDKEAALDMLTETFDRAINKLLVDNSTSEFANPIGAHNL
ncbi:MULTISPECIES: hypothetical protein [Pseudoalteromonas]|uniref:ATP-grasp domain-containing protein n=1 Tax=Pseudoalteromonas amylolytica TaxID=1859457 RepID=A0A1S1MXW8_9GAMM|nr:MULTISPECIES: hypothetical protein [Pseudoalteromonas]OHU89146.1 hypothetical protein BFC16_05730 [Pseudoalteromonas sp. JW3]OHU92046.1 hypothetical protein BET10_06835 [Pseudoalteromonas amylolytica]